MENIKKLILHCTFIADKSVGKLSTMKKFFVASVFVAFTQLHAFSQSTVKYTIHTIQKGETLSGLSAKYKTTVGDIMRLNGMNTNSKLQIGEKVKIPANGAKVPATAQTTPPATNPPKKEVAAPAVQQPDAGAATAGIIHTVQKGETLYKIGKQYHVSIDKIKTWNHLTTDKVSIGQQLSINTPATVTAQKPPVQQQQPQVDNTVSTPVTTTAPQEQPKAEQQVDPSTTTAPVSAPPADTKPKVKAESQPMIPDGKDPYVEPSKISTQGYFTSLFGVDVDGRSLETTNGVSMTFKTASGWTDKKYYILINDVPPGSIVKITSAQTNKIVYAKVLWKITDTKENDGLNFRISNAAADALGITDTKFPLTVTYYE